MQDNDTAVYNGAEFYALAVLQECSTEFRNGTSRSAEMISLINEVIDRFGTTGLGCLVAALGRIGSTELAVRADRDGTTADALLAEWRQHKLEQHSQDDA